MTNDTEIDTTDLDAAETPEIDLAVVEAQLKGMKDGTLEEIAKRVGQQVQQRRDAKLNLGSMSDRELREFTRRKYGF